MLYHLSSMLSPVDVTQCVSYSHLCSKKPADQASETSQAMVAPKLFLSLSMAQRWEGKGLALMKDAGFGEHTPLHSSDVE